MVKTKTNARWKRTLRLAGSLLTLGLFVWLLARQDWTRVLEMVRGMPAASLLLAFGLYLSGQALNAARWYILLRAQTIRINLQETIRIMFAGAFASNFLPSTIGGDALRMVALFQHTENRVTAAASVVLDRFINLFAFFTVLPFGGWVLATPVVSAAGMPLLAGGLAGLPQKIRAWASHSLDEFYQAVRLWRQRPKALVTAFVVSWFSIFVIFLALWVLATSLGIPVSLPQVMGITSLTYFLTLLPVSINGYGVREVAITTLYMRLGASLEAATALAVISRLMMVLATVPGAWCMPKIVKTVQE